MRGFPFCFKHALPNYLLSSFAPLRLRVKIIRTQRRKGAKAQKKT
jgi:hypothetical protein